MQTFRLMQNILAFVAVVFGLVTIVSGSRVLLGADPRCAAERRDNMRIIIDQVRYEFVANAVARRRQIVIAGVVLRHKPVRSTVALDLGARAGQQRANQ